MAVSPFTFNPSGNPDAASPETAVEDDFEIEIEGVEPDVDELSDSSASDLGSRSHFDNLADLFDPTYLDKLGSEIVQKILDDDNSRKTWMEQARIGLKSLGLKPGDEGEALFPGGCTATMPLIPETAVKFQSKISTELLPPDGPVKTKVFGKKDEAKLLKANRVATFLNYQITQVLDDFEDNMEKTALYSSIFGSAFKKNVWDPNEEAPLSEFVAANDFIVSYPTPSLKKAERYTHVIPVSERTFENRIATGVYIGEKDQFQPYAPSEDEFTSEWNKIIGQSTGPSEFGYVVYEHYCYYDFSEYVPSLGSPSGIRKPFVITVEKQTQKILSIRRDWSPDDLSEKRLDTFTHYKFIPGFGFYGLGLVHLLGNTQIALTAMLRSLVDAGYFNNLQGGFKLKGAKVIDNSNSFQMGEYKDIEGIADKTIRDVILPHQFKEPSQVLFALLQFLDKKGGDFANATDQVVANSQTYGPVGTTMALLEASAKLYAAIYKRYHKALANELKIIARLNYEWMPDSYPFEMPGIGDDDSYEVFRSDFDPKIVDVAPVSDPNISSQAHRVALANAKLEGALKAKGAAPDLALKLEPIIRDFFVSLDPQMDPNDLFEQKAEIQPKGPVEDIIEATQGRPIKAFPGQDHQAHVRLKQAWLSDPNQGGSKIMEQFVPAILANIREHMLMDFQEKLDGAVKATGAATDPQTLEMVKAQAAEQMAQISQQAAQAGSPESKIADAITLEAQTKARQQEFNEREALANYALKAGEQVIRLAAQINRQAETDSKVDIAKLKLQGDQIQQFGLELLRQAGAKDIASIQARAQRESRE